MSPSTVRVFGGVAVPIPTYGVTQPPLPDITNVFVGLTTLVGLVPVIGPLIVKIFTIPFFWLLNGLGYFTSAYAIKKGYGRDIISHRLITIVLLIGIILGYILGHLIPLN